MATVTIGGEALTVSLPNFRTLKAAWRFIAAGQSASDPMAGVEAILGVISVGTSPPVTLDALEDRLRPSEMVGLRPFMNELLVEIGLATPSGEALPAEEQASPSTATSTPSSSPSSLASDPPTGI